MNSLYTLGVRQTNSIQADLERLRTGDASASLLGLSPILILFPSTPPEPSPTVISCGRFWRWMRSNLCQLTVQPSYLSLVRADFRLVSGYEQDGRRLRFDG